MAPKKASPFSKISVSAAREDTQCWRATRRKPRRDDQGNALLGHPGFHWGALLLCLSQGLSYAPPYCHLHNGLHMQIFDFKSLQEVKVLRCFG